MGAAHRLPELVRLRAAGHLDFTMSVNVSQVQFRHPHFLDMLRSGAGGHRRAAGIHRAGDHRIDGDGRTGPADRDAGQIKRTGVSIAIDDFGTGFSSLSYLQRLQVDRLKIDRAFVTEITGSARGSSIAEMVISWAATWACR
jgi:EAL domain-containing protein (putative c-di-GMP-specific phosphodiesterase class I)